MSGDDPTAHSAASTIDQSSIRQEPAALRVPGLTILFHPDPRRVGDRVALPALSSGRQVQVSRLEPLFSAPTGGPAEPLADPHLSRAGLVLAPGRAAGGVRLRRGEVRTRLEIDGVELEAEVDFDQQQLASGITVVLAERLVLLLHTLETRPRAADEANFELVGESPVLVRLRQQIRQVAPHATPVLLRGETGTGKELVASAIHLASTRKEGPSVCVNMGAVPASLAAAELFGAARGAYTGASQKREGYFQKADGGTLFLDEVGEAPLEVQALLLRALESGEVQPVGSTEPTRVDVRVVAATDADLEAGIAAGRFRAPLLHRLGGYEIRLPPLRERREDIGRLLLHFLRQELEAVDESGRLEPVGPRQRPWLPPTLVARLARYAWPGNVRQLRNVARQLTIAGGEAKWPELERVVDDLLRPVHGESADHGLEGSGGLAPSSTRSTAPTRSYRQPYEISDEELVAALRAHRWRLKPTAAGLKVSRSSLYALIDRCPTLRRASDLSRQEIGVCRERHGGDLDAMAEELEVSRHGLQRQMRELEIGLVQKK